MEKLNTIPEAAEKLNMSERWVWDRVLRREIPTVCLGRRRLIRNSDLEAYVESRVERKNG